MIPLRRFLVSLVRVLVSAGLVLLGGCDLLGTGESEEGFLAEPGPILFGASPEGQDMHFLYSMDPDGSRIRQLTDDPEFTATGISFSPNGQRAVAPGPFPGPDVGGPQDPAHWWGGLYVMAADGTNRRLLFDYKEGVPNSASGTPPLVWSPDGEQLIFHRLLIPEAAGQVVPILANADGTNPRRLTDRGSTIQITDWYPNGQYLIGSRLVAFQDSTGTLTEYNQLVKLDLEGNVVQTWGNEKTDYNVPILSPDGQQVAFKNRFIQVDTLENGNIFRSSQSEIYLMNADGTRRRALTNSEHQYVTPVVWSPDGTHILVYASDRTPDEERPPPFTQYILMAAADGSGVTDITPFPDNPSAEPKPWDWKR